MNSCSDDDLTRWLWELVRRPSVSGGEGPLARWLAAELPHAGFAAHVDSVGNLVAEAGSGSTHVALVGHIDTVPGGPEPRLTATELHGRGAVDAKAPFAAFIAASLRALAQGADLRVTLIGCVEEEVPSSRGARARMRDPAPDYLIVGEPSGWDGITLGYKGYLRASLDFQERGRHSAHDAPTAAARAARAWVAIEAAALAFDGERSAAFERVLPALLAMRCEPTPEGERARLELSLRLPPDLPPAAAEAWLAEIAPGIPLSVLGAIPAWRGPRAGALPAAFARAIGGLGGRPRYQVKTGTADLNLLAPAWGCPALAYGPGDSAFDHAPDERIELAELHRGAAVLTAALTRLASSPVPR